MTGLPRFTLSRGEVVFSDGKITAEDGRGHFVERTPNPPVNQALSSWKALNTPQPVEALGREHADGGVSDGCGGERERRSPTLAGGRQPACGMVAHPRPAGRRAMALRPARSMASRS